MSKPWQRDPAPLGDEKQREAQSRPTQFAPYGPIFHDTRSMVMLLIGMSESALNDAVIEWSTDYKVFCSNYRGPYLVDAYIGFAEMLRQWLKLVAAMEPCELSGLTDAQIFLIWAWHENDVARHFLDGEAAAYGWEHNKAVEVGVVAAVSAAKSLFYAKFLMACGDDRIRQ